MKHIKLSYGLLALALAASACRPFDIETPDSFIDLDEERSSSYNYRATSADQVVVSVKVVDNENRGTLEFWSEAARNKVRDRLGYALLEEQDMTARGGVPGKQMRFGRDESGHTFHYWVTLFVRHVGRDPRIWVLEAGGEEEAFEGRRSDVEAMIASFVPE